MKITATIITLNEELHIVRAIESLRCCDEILVLDSGSADRTMELAEKLGARVLESPWRGYAGQKNWAAERATHDWILSLDADERVTPALASEIKALMAAQPTAAAFRVPRVTWHLGRWVRTTDWYPDYQTRLYDRRSAEWTGRYVHEAVTVRGATGQLRAELQHFAFRDIADHLETIDRYTSYAARQMHEAGTRAGLLQIAGHPPLAFLRNYIAHGGIRDGTPGFIISALNAYYVLLKFAKLWELQQGSPIPDP
jgi:glycosyltransferase involved in cell wall biosynthesis